MRPPPLTRTLVCPCSTHHAHQISTKGVGLMNAETLERVRDSLTILGAARLPPFPSPPPPPPPLELEPIGGFCGHHLAISAREHFGAAAFGQQSRRSVAPVQSVSFRSCLGVITTTTRSRGKRAAAAARQTIRLRLLLARMLAPARRRLSTPARPLFCLSSDCQFEDSCPLPPSARVTLETP